MCIATEAKKSVLSPLSRYWRARCCDDTDHVANLEDPDFERMIFSGLDSFRRIIKDVLFTSGIGQVVVYTSGQLCSGMPGARHTSEEIRDAPAILWGGTTLCTLPPSAMSVLASRRSSHLTSPAPRLRLPLHPPQRGLSRGRGGLRLMLYCGPRGEGRGRGNNWRGRGGRGGRRGRGFRGLN
jgi:hypothetical protein